MKLWGSSSFLILLTSSNSLNLNPFFERIPLAFVDEAKSEVFYGEGGTIREEFDGEIGANNLFLTDSSS